MHLHPHLHGADEGKRNNEEEEGGGGGVDDDETEEGQKSSAVPGPSAHSTSNATIEDVRALRVNLETLLREAGLKVDLNLVESIP